MEINEWAETLSRNRYSARTDKNEADIVKALRKMGIGVKVGVDDILIGINMRNYWFEIKDPKHVSKKTGKINESAKKESQKILEKTWKGQYHIVSSLNEILEIIGVNNESNS